MAFPGLTTYVDGTVMDWTPIASDFAAIRAWLNAVPNGDVVNGTIQREHLARPPIQGFPIQGMEGTVQSAYWRTLGLSDPDGMVPGEWGVRRNRFTVFPLLMPPDNVWRFPVGATLRMPNSSHLHVGVGLEWQHRVRDAGGTVKYPDALGAGVQVGWIGVELKDRLSGVVTRDARHRVFVYPQQDAARAQTIFHDSGEIRFDTTSAFNSVIDLVLYYEHHQASAGVGAQLDIGVVSMSILID